jgi:hypothetical protein
MAETIEIQLEDDFFWHELLTVAKIARTQKLLMDGSAEPQPTTRKSQK